MITQSRPQPGTPKLPRQILGKLTIPADITAEFSLVLQTQGFSPLPIQLNHALRAGGYPLHLRDPFDRMLAAQAELEGLTLLSNDPELWAFPCELLWSLPRGQGFGEITDAVKHSATPSSRELSPQGSLACTPRQGRCWISRDWSRWWPAAC